MKNVNLTETMLQKAIPIRGSVPGISGQLKRVCDIAQDEDGNYVLIFKQQGHHYVTLSLEDFHRQLKQLA